MLPPLVFCVGALYTRSQKSQRSDCYSGQNPYIVGYMEQTIIIDEILFALAIDQDITTKESFHKLKNTILAKYRISE